MLINNIAITLVENIHTLEDDEVTELLKTMMKECDRRFIDYEEVIEEGREEIGNLYEPEEENDISGLNPYGDTYDEDC